MSLKELRLKKWYSSASDNVLKEFYNLVLSAAVSYDRIAGFFSPSIFALAARGFASGIKNDLKIRLITSIEVPDVVLDNMGDELGEDQFSDYVKWDVDALTDELKKNYLKVFRNLLASGQLEIRVAILKADGIMHQKIGIIYDENGDAISFSGSNNETLYGWSKNVEEFKVFSSWSLATYDYYENDKKQFEDLWNNAYEGIKVVKISEAIKEKIIKSIKAESTEEVVRVIRELEENPDGNPTPTPEPQVDRIRPYQKEAIEFWKDNGYKAVFAMATGTGKTYTAVRGLKEFFEDKGYLRAVIAVPLRTLADQWEGTLIDAGLDIKIINTTNSDGWKKSIKRLEDNHSFDNDKDFIIITTYANLDKITEADFGDDIILVADEMHNLVTERGIKLSSDEKYKYKLGLSATPQRIWKKDESRILSKIFGDEKYEYGIDLALENGYLVPYDYHPEFVQLMPDEFEEYVALTREIAKLVASHGNTKDEENDDKTLNTKRIIRARIKKNAASKIPTLMAKLQEFKSSDALDRALIYVDNEAILSDLQKALSDKHIVTSRFLGNTPDKDRKTIIEALCNKGIDAVVAIRCLDEGVDIPSARMAFILSNGTDPREYVQRLGRVLRLDKQYGKEHASVYDYFVLPPESTYYKDDFERNTARNIVKNEMRRTLFFSSLARNGDEAKEKIALMQIKYGFYISEDELKEEKGDDE